MHGPWAERVKRHHVHVTIVNITNFKIVTSAAYIVTQLSLKECMHHAIATCNCTQTIIGNAGNEQRA